MTVTRVASLERPREPAAQRVVSGGERELHVEAVAIEQLLQGDQRDDVDVLPGLHVVLGRVVLVHRERVPERAGPRDVRDRERLVPQDERRDVVPARKVLRADEGRAARLQDAAGLEGEVVEPLHMLDDLVGVHQGEHVVVVRPTLLEVPRPGMEAPRLGQCPALIDDLDPVHVIWFEAGTEADPVGPRAVVAADVEQAATGRRHGIEERSLHLILGVVPGALGGLSEVHGGDFTRASGGSAWQLESSDAEVPTPPA